MIFRIFKVYRGIKKGSKDPSGFAKDEALDMLRGIIIPFSIAGLVLIILFFLLGYTSFWFGPAGFFKVVFVIGLLVFLFWVLITQIILSVSKKILHNAKQKVDSHVFHYDVTPK